MNKNYLLPGEPLRKGVDLIADKKTGALIVIGNSNKLEKISSGGIALKNCIYSPELFSFELKTFKNLFFSSDAIKPSDAFAKINFIDFCLTLELETRE